MQVGYARISTKDQDLALQLGALKKVGCEKIFTDQASGRADRERPGLKETLAYLQGGDTFVIWKLDRLGRSVQDLIRISMELKVRNINLYSITDKIDTETPMGRFFFYIMAALAEMEREMIVERTMAGLAAARAAGRIGGRKTVMTAEKINAMLKRLNSGMSPQDIATSIGVSLSTVYRWHTRIQHSDQGLVMNLAEV